MGQITPSSLTEISSWEDSYRFLGVKLINVSDFIELLARLSFNTVLLIIIVHFIYAKTSRNKDFSFSFLAVGTIVFFLCTLLSSVKLEMGFALGLFAIFGILRYRTDTIPIKEMTYLFVVIGVSVINALSNKKVSYAELILTNLIIIGGVWGLEKLLQRKPEQVTRLIYENIGNVHLEKKEDLLADLKTRTGINVIHYEIKQIDFLRDTADIMIYHMLKEEE